MFRILHDKRMIHPTPEYLKLASSHSDKHGVKDIVHRLCPELKFSPVLGTFETFDQVETILDQLPFVVKVSHWCGDVRILKTKEDFYNNREVLKKWFDEKLQSVYSKTEIHYTHITPTLFAEKYIDADLHELKIHCIHGQPVLFNVIRNSANGINPYATQPYFIMFDTDWNRLNFTRSDIRSVDRTTPFEKPSNLDYIKDVCNKLTKHIDYVRLDLYLSRDGEVYFGEYTFTPSGLGRQFSNPEVESDMLKCYTSGSVDYTLFHKYIIP